jgi:hypothetical protein
MTVSPSIPATIEMRPSRLAGLVMAAALAAAVTTGALLTFVVDLGAESAQRRVQPTTITPSFIAGAQHIARIGSMAQAQHNSAVLHALGLGPRETEYVHGITSLTPAQQAAAFGRR